MFANNDYAKRYCIKYTTVKVIPEGVSIWQKIDYVICERSFKGEGSSP